MKTVKRVESEGPTDPEAEEAERVVRRVVRAMVRQRSLADDCCQEAMLRVLRFWSSCRGNRSGWIKTVAANTVRSQLRRAKRTRMASLDTVLVPVVSPRLGPAGTAQLAELGGVLLRVREVILEVVHEWRPARRRLFCEILRLRVFEGRSWKEIAAELDLASEQAAKTRWSRMWSQIQERLARRLPEFDPRELGLVHGTDLAELLAGAPAQPGAALLSASQVG